MAPVRLFEKRKERKQMKQVMSFIISISQKIKKKKFTLMMQKSQKFTKTHASDMIHLDFKGLS